MHRHIQTWSSTATVSTVMELVMSLTTWQRVMGTLWTILWESGITRTACITTNHLCPINHYYHPTGLPPPLHHNHFMAFFPGPPGWASARREPLDFMVQGKINRGRHTDHPAGRHSIRTKQCPPPPSSIFYRPDALPAAQPTVSKHRRQKPSHRTA